MFGLSSLYIKLIGGVVAALLLLGLVLGLKHYKALAESRGETIAVICHATRDASGQPKLKCGEVAKQIGFMGQTIGTLTTAIHKQNEAVAAMGAETMREKAAAAKASQKAATRAREAEATAGRLIESSRSSKPPSGSQCEPSKAVQESWR
jgi:hypothetical protein